jgi:hypothetical protein
MGWLPEEYDVKPQLSDPTDMAEGYIQALMLIVKGQQRRIEIAERAKPVFNMVEHLRRQYNWSERTFGPGDRTQGVIDHIRKELIEIESDPSDISEWIDVVILALDGARRSGASPEQIVAALVAKQAKNEQRKWPDWRTADPNKAIEHVRT